MRRYAIIFFAGLLGLLAAFSVFNLVVDPYDATGWVSLDGVNERKSRSHEDGRRVLVSHQLLKRPEHSIIIGSSRVVDGFEVSYDDAFWPGGLYNAGLRGSNAFELAHVAGLAGQKDNLRCVVIGLDVSEFSGGDKFKSAFLISRFTDGPHWKSLGRMMLSPNTFMRSVQTVEDNMTGGSDKPPFKDVYAHGEQRERFINSARNTYLSHHSLRMSEKRIDFLFTALDALAADGVQIIGFIHPVHAWYEEASLRAGQEESYHTLREILAQRFDNLAREAVPHKPCTSSGNNILWDFSGFQSVSVTPLPEDMQEISHEYFHEPAHYLPATGSIILGKIKGEAVTEAFGITLTPKVVDQTRLLLAQRRNAYMQTLEGQQLDQLIQHARAEMGDTEPVSIQPLTKSDWTQLDNLLRRGD